MGALSEFFGYILNYIYNLVSNYGVAIILFSVVLKLVLLPLSIKQQKTLIKTSKIQGKIKDIQAKYTKKDGERPSPEEQTKMNQEMMALYKQENISPFSGCLSTILQLVLLIAVFGLVRNPLTFMLKVNQETVNKVSNYIQEENPDYNFNSAYPQIGVLKYVAENKDQVIYLSEEVKENSDEEANTEEANIEENEELKSDEESKVEDEKEQIKLSDLYINMNFLGLDLNKIPNQNFGDYTVYIIPVLYVLTSILSMKMTTGTSEKKKKDGEEKAEENMDMSSQMNKSMTWFMPIMAVTVAIMAPLGLALYWLVNNILMILERLIISKVLETKKEAENE